MLGNNLKKIREYTKKNIELSKCHHFVFNLPLNKMHEGADAVIIGLNPGESISDWSYTENLPTEESSDFDWKDKAGKGRSATKWLGLCEEYIGTSKVILSEFFYWSSKQIGNDTIKGETFKERFGYNFKGCPHFNFCKEHNIDLINFHQPRIIIAPGTSYTDFFAKIYQLDHIKTVKCVTDSRNRKIIVHYEFMNIPFLFTPHWTSGYVSNIEKAAIKNYITSIK